MIVIHTVNATGGALIIVHKANNMQYSKETIVKL